MCIRDRVQGDQISGRSSAPVGQIFSGRGQSSLTASVFVPVLTPPFIRFMLNHSFLMFLSYVRYGHNRSFLWLPSANLRVISSFPLSAYSFTAMEQRPQDAQPPWDSAQRRSATGDHFSAVSTHLSENSFALSRLSLIHI